MVSAEGAGIEGQDEERTRAAVHEPQPSGQRQLVIMSPGSVQTLPLVGHGELTLGRSGRSAVRVDDPLLSREHLRVRWTADVTVEDLGSVNGTKLGDRQLQAHEPTPLTAGHLVSLGGTLLVLRLQPERPSLRTLESYEAFESLVRQRCLRAGRAESFSVVRLFVTGRAAPERLRDVVTRELGVDDVVASYAPGEFALLLGRADARTADDVSGRLEAALLGEGLRASVGAASYPRDGTTAEALLAGATPHGEDAGEVTAVLGSEQTRTLARVVERVAQGNITVLFQGETGTGKDVFAQLLHHRSPRASGPFVRINCAALSDSLLESELFGHAKGAFTGAHTDRVGMLESASGGTVFLDELGELTPAHQAALLVAIERKQIVRVGTTTPLTIDVRFISATNRDLEVEVEARRFRRDLLHRLNGVIIDVPPLRVRMEEVLPLAQVFLREFAAQAGRPTPSLSDEAARMLGAYHWPGNVRELRNVMERALLFATSDRIGPEQLPLGQLTRAWTATTSAGAPSAPEAPLTLSDADKAERARMIEALRQTGGNRTEAAVLLGVPRRTFTHRMGRLGIRAGF